MRSAKHRVGFSRGTGGGREALFSGPAVRRLRLELSRVLQPKSLKCRAGRPVSSATAFARHPTSQAGVKACFHSTSFLESKIELFWATLRPHRGAPRIAESCCCTTRPLLVHFALALLFALAVFVFLPLGFFAAAAALWRSHRPGLRVQRGRQILLVDRRSATSAACIGLVELALRCRTKRISPRTVKWLASYGGWPSSINRRLPLSTTASPRCRPAGH
jgi:hypothetical protein